MITVQQASANWLAKQDEKALRIAREIIRLRKGLTALQGTADWKSAERAREGGFIDGLRLALSYLGDRPGDISQTGAEGFILNVKEADRAQSGTGERA